MAVLNLKDIRIDGDTQARERLSIELVDQYAEEMLEGDNFPPLTIYHDGSSYWLSDGFHRLFAVKKLNKKEVEVEIRQGTQRDAQLFAMTANKGRGMKPTGGDNRKCATRMLKDVEWSKWSSREIARWVGCSHTLVNKIRAELEKTGEIKEEQVRKLVMYGQETTMVSKKKEGKKKEKPAQDQEVNQEGVSEAKEEQVDPRDQQIVELVDTINVLEAENQRLRDAIAIGQWDATDIEKIDAQETIEELRERIRILEIDNASLKDSRDMFQARNDELMRSVKSMSAKLKQVA